MFQPPRAVGRHQVLAKQACLLDLYMQGSRRPLVLRIAMSRSMQPQTSDSCVPPAQLTMLGSCRALTPIRAHAEPSRAVEPLTGRSLSACCFACCPSHCCTCTELRFLWISLAAGQRVPKQSVQPLGQPWWPLQPLHNATCSHRKWQ